MCTIGLRISILTALLGPTDQVMAADRIVRGRSVAIAAPTVTIIDLGSFHPNDPYGPNSSYANDLNEFGQIVGEADYDPFLYSNGNLMKLGRQFAGPVSAAHGINESGQIVGELDGRAFLYTNGSMTYLGTLGGLNSSALDINDTGQIVGYSHIPGNQSSHAFLHTNGNMIDLGTLGGSYSFAYGINNDGDVVGNASIDSDAARHAFLYSNGIMEDLGTFGGASSSAHAINDQGQIVGSAQLANGETHAFSFANDTMTDLGTLGGSYSAAYGINDNGQIVGSANTAFLYANGKMIKLEDLLPPDSGWKSLSIATAINNQGAIVGYGDRMIDGYIVDRAFLLIGAVTPATNSPPVVDDQSFTLAAGSPRGTMAGLIIASDPDPGQSLTYSLVSGNSAGAFQLNSTTGVLTVSNALAVKRPRTFSLRVKVTDSGSPALSDEATLTVSVVQ